MTDTCSVEVELQPSELGSVTWSSKVEVEPATSNPEEPVAPEMKLPETPAAELEPEVSVASVFGDAPTEGEANKDIDPQPI